MTSPDGSNFSYTESSIAANLTLNIPNDAVDTLQQVAQFSSEVQVNWESSVRFLQDYSSYLQALPNIQRQVNDGQREYLQIIKDTQSAVDAMRSSGGFGPVIPQQGMGVGSAAAFGAAGFAVGTQTTDRMVPGSMNAGQSVAATTAASMQAQEQRDTAVYGQVLTQGGLPGSGVFVPPGMGSNSAAAGYPLPHQLVPGQNGYIHPGTPAAATQSQHHRAQEVARQAAIQAHRAIDPGGTGRHSAFAEEDDEEETPTRRGGSAKKGWSHGLYNMVQQAGIAETQFAGALGPGGTPLASRAALASNLLGGLSQAAPWLKGLGGVGLGIGAAGLAWNAVQSAGESIQGFRNQDVHEHSLGGGMKVQGDIMSMALNPFISTEQAREIVMSGLNNGYSGKEYDTVVDFMKDNLLDMNMKVSDSVQLLHNNVEIGRQSIESLKIDLGTVALGARTGSKSLEARNDQYKNLSEFFYDQNGAQGGGGSAAAVFGTYMFDKPLADGSPNPLADKADDITIAILSSEIVQLELYRKNPGVAESPLDIVGALGDEKAIKQAYEFLTKRAKSAKSKERFYRMLTMELGINLSKGDAYNLYTQLVGGDVIKQTEQTYAEATKITINGKETSALQTEEMWRKEKGLEGATGSGAEHDQYMKDQGLTEGATGPLSVGGVSLNPVGPGFGTKPVHGIDAAPLVNLAKGGHVIAVDPQGNKHLIDGSDAQQVIALSNPASGWKIAHTDEDLSKYVNYGSSGSPIIKFTNDGLQPNMLHGKSPEQWIIDKAGTPQSPGALDTYMATNGERATNMSGDTGTTGSDGTQPQGLRSNGNTFTAPSGSDGSKPLIDFTPRVQQFFQWAGIGPGTVDRSPNGEASNLGYGGAQRNSAPPGTGPR